MSLLEWVKSVFSSDPVWEGGSEVVPVVDVERIYVETDIKREQNRLRELQETSDSLVGRINDYGKALDTALEQELIEYKKLENELAKKEGRDQPHADQKSREQQIKDAIKDAKQREEKGNVAPSEGPDPRVHKLYKKYAKIYHPDKADDEDKAYYTDVFQMLNFYKIANDYRGLKEFCKTLRKKTKVQIMSTIDDLRLLLSELREEVGSLEIKCRELLNDPLQERADEYYADPEAHILRARATINTRIAAIKKKLDNSGVTVRGTSLWG